MRDLLKTKEYLTKAYSYHSTGSEKDVRAYIKNTQKRVKVKALVVGEKKHI